MTYARFLAEMAVLLLAVFLLGVAVGLIAATLF